QYTCFHTKESCRLLPTVFCFIFPRAVSPPGGKFQSPRSCSRSIGSWTATRRPSCCRLILLFALFFNISSISSSLPPWLVHYLPRAWVRTPRIIRFKQESFLSQPRNPFPAATL